jgi:hypothetical protein
LTINNATLNFLLTFFVEMQEFKLNTNLAINGVPVTSLTGDLVQKQKISEIGDGGLAQETDAFLIQRGSANYKITRDNITPQATEILKGSMAIATQSEVNAGTNNTKAITPQTFKNGNIATQAAKGITQLATPTEYFNKDNTKTVTANNIANDVRLAPFAVLNLATGLTQAVAIGGSYNLLTPLVTANEVQRSDFPIVYKNTANAVQNNLLQIAAPTTDNFLLLPSPANTFNKVYVPYIIRVNCTATIPSVASDRSTEFFIVLRRVVDNSEVGRSAKFSKGPNAAATTEFSTALIQTFVNSETDPFVVGGCRLFLEITAGSNTGLTLTAEEVTIFRN